MAISTCVKCGGQSFEMMVQKPEESEYKLIFVQCSNCGGVIGVMDFMNIGSQLDEIKRKLGISRALPL